MFHLDKIVHLRSVFESKGFHINKQNRGIYVNWHAEAVEKLKNSKIASLKDSLWKAKKN